MTRGATIATVVLLASLTGACSDDATTATDAGRADHGTPPADAALDGPAVDGPARDVPASDGPATDGPASDGPPRPDGYGDLLSSTCAQLQANYLTILEQAKACNPVAAMAQCMVRVDDELACPCDTYAQSTNEGPLSRLATIKGDWRQAGCAAQVACLPTPCPSARSNNCQAVSGNQGRCEN